MWLSEILDRHCQQRGDAPALAENGRVLTWRELRAAASGVAACLASQGIGLGDRVAVYSRNRSEVLVSYFALAYLGAPFVPVNHAMPAAEYGEVGKRLDIAHVLGEAEALSRLGLPTGSTTSFEDNEFQRAMTTGEPPPAPATGMDDTLTVLLTSGTTGLPKGVAQTSGALRQATLSWLAEVKADDRIRFLNLNSLSHGGITLTFHYLAAGATVFVQREFQPRTVLRALAEHDITHIWLVPHMLRFLVTASATEPVPLPALREILFGASPITAKLLADAARTFGCAFRNVYGMTEAGGTFCTWLWDGTDATRDVPLESSGRAVPGIRVGIRGPDGHPLPLGETGEIVVGSAGRMTGYVADPGATGEVLDGGWVRTGDLGLMDEHGYVHLRGRSKDLIKRGGQNVFPAEIEQVVGQLAQVREVAVAGVPDETWGEVPVAYVVAEPGAVLSRREIAKHLRERLASYKQPARIDFVEALPRNGAGKVLRRELTRPNGASA
ncbi:class I adenylate-forming enzyme family protein [Amycolatopsis silviterrae]|uniref:Class I adenylate-forming enzyme family protein n=1 Tax=Amycolatopsis silviterrae TaxID=1656914 RepID=A0ABW5H3F4_9PSEU